MCTGVGLLLVVLLAVAAWVAVKGLADMLAPSLLGLAVLFYTAISMVQKVEAAFNDIWHVRETRQRAPRSARAAYDGA